MSESKTSSSKLWPWPYFISILAQAALMNNFNHFAQKQVISFQLLIMGAAFLVSNVLLRFVDLPRAEANPSKDELYPTNEYQRAVVGPLMLLGVLIMGLAGALLVLPDDPTATNAAWAIFALLGVAVLITTLVRAWRISMLRPKKE
jgi:peptidoglycan/LPS O-acetylase OafA/YrhL